jgi:hypothetical protein
MIIDEVGGTQKFYFQPITAILKFFICAMIADLICFLLVFVEHLLAKV